MAQQQSNINMNDLANVRESFIRRHLAEEDSAGDKKMGMVMMMAAFGRPDRASIDARSQPTDCQPSLGSARSHYSYEGGKQESKKAIENVLAHQVIEESVLVVNTIKERLVQLNSDKPLERPRVDTDENLISDRDEDSPIQVAISSIRRLVSSSLSQVIDAIDARLWECAVARLDNEKLRLHGID